MKKSLQLTLILSALLFTFSCDGGEVADASDPGSALTETWQVTSISAYDDVACSETELFTYGSTSIHSDAVGEITASTAADCQNLEWFVSATADDDIAGASFIADTFCNGQDALPSSMMP